MIIPCCIDKAQQCDWLIQCICTRVHAHNCMYTWQYEHPFSQNVLISMLVCHYYSSGPAAGNCSRPAFSSCMIGDLII